MLIQIEAESFKDKKNSKYDHSALSHSGIYQNHYPESEYVETSLHD